jgi:hypothetical protein
MIVDSVSSTAAAMASHEADSDDDEILDRSQCLIPGLLDDEDPTMGEQRLMRRELVRRSTFIGEGVDEQGNESVLETVDEQFIPVEGTLSPTAANTTTTATSTTTTAHQNKTARCKTCGILISREVEEIELHMATCGVFSDSSKTMQVGASNSRTLGGIPRKDKSRSGTRIIYRLARSQSKLFKPREVCSFQDSFIDSITGTCYVYEISV